MKNRSDLPDITFLDLPEITFCVFYPETASQGPDVPGQKKALSFPLDENVSLGAMIHLAQEAEVAPNLLFFHGNGEVVADYDEIGPLYTMLGINFTVVDYRGYGTSGGNPTYSSMIKDAHIVFCQFLGFLEEAGLKGPVVVMGRSLGSASALELAAHYPEKIFGLILESGFAHTYNLLTTLGVDPRLLDSSKEHLVSNLEKMKMFEGPVLVIHGEIDEIIPLSDGLELYQAAKNETKEMLVIRDAGHNTLMLLGLEDYMEAIGRFVGNSMTG